jgi:hypothetical protein
MSILTAEHAAKLDQQLYVAMRRTSLGFNILRMSLKT